MHGCRPSPGPTDGEDAVASIGRYGVTVAIALGPIDDRSTHRWHRERAGLILAGLEAGLASMRAVAPSIDGNASPGLAGWLRTGARRWRGTLTVDDADGPTGERLRVTLELCEPDGPCRSESAEAARNAALTAVGHLLSWAATELAVEVPDAARRRWGARESDDDYAELVSGRAAAIVYGLLPPVAREDIGVRRNDPVVRAVYLDPGMPLARWMLARRELARGRHAKAAATIDGYESDEDRPFVADLVRAKAAQRSDDWQTARRHWAAVQSLYPDDPRFVAARARAYVRTRSLAAAEALLDDLPPQHARSAAALDLRVQTYEARGRYEGYEELLVAWRHAAPRDPEPLRRAIAHYLRSDRLSDAFDLVDALRERGRVSEAMELSVALGNQLGHYDQAADDAAALGRDETARHIRARRAFRNAPHEVPDVLAEPVTDDERIVVAYYVVGNDNERALALAREVLRRDPWRAGALAIEADALALLGRIDEARAARERLDDVDPAYSEAISGPSTAAGGTGAGSQEQSAAP